MIYEIKPSQNMNGYSKPWPAGGGANRWDEQWELGTYDTTTGAKTSDNNRIRSKNKIPVSESTEYYIARPLNTLVVYMYEADDTFIKYEALTSSNKITTAEDCAFITFAIGSGGAPVTKYNHDIAVNYPSTVTTYSPYENVCPFIGYNIPGIDDTIYQCVLDSNTGIMTISYGYKELTGEETVTESSTNRYMLLTGNSNNFMNNFAIPNSQPYPIPLCSHYEGVAYKLSSELSPGVCTTFSGASGKTISFYTLYDETTDFIAYLTAQATAETPIAFMLPLVTPVEVQLTQEQINELIALMGEARNFGSRTNMLNTWMKLAQGHPVSDEELHMLRPSMRLPDDVVLRPTFEDTPLPIVDPPAAEPEENITESEES